jgi:hypothetical protein
MKCVPELKFPFSRVRVLTVIGLLFTAGVASAQYTAQVLPPPADLPSNAITRAFALNGVGQVFGEAFGGGRVEPVLWTGGVPVRLDIPNGYSWDDLPGQQFLNDAGTAVAKVVLGSNQLRVIVWQGATTQILDPAPLQTSCSYAQYYPVGLNNAGAILIVGASRTDSGTNICENMWIQHADGSVTALPSRDPAGIPNVCELTYSAYLSGNHLNNADHVSLQRTLIAFNAASNCDPFTELAGVLAGGFFSPISADAFATQVNNLDQVLLLRPNGGSPRWALWDGVAIVDLGGFSGVASLNDLGQAVFTDGSGPQIYRNGVITPLVLPLLPKMLAGPGAFLVNSAGQLVGDALFDLSGATDRAILFTPTTPTITWAAPPDIVYGTALNATQLNATANVPGVFAYTPPAGTLLPAGSSALSVTFTPNDPAFSTATANVTLHVQPALLTVTALDAAKVFGAPLPAFGAGYAGFVNADSPASLTGALVLTTTATPASPVGQYAISPSGVSSPNYTVNFVAGMLTIAQAGSAVALASSALSSVAGQSVTFTATVTSVAPGAGIPGGAVTFSDGAAVLGTVPLSNGVATLTTNTLALGTHTIAAQYGGDSSFTVSSKSITQAIVAPLFQLTASVKIVKNGAGQYVATITIKNAGNLAVNGALMGSSLNNTGSVDGATTLGDIGPGKSVTVFNTFPSTAGVSGSVNNALRMQVNWLLGSTSISQRVALP